MYNYLDNPIALLNGLSLPLRCSQRSSLESIFIPRCWWVVNRVTIKLLKFNDGWFGLSFPGKKITSWACLWWSGLKLISYWKSHLFILFISSFKLFEDKIKSWTTKKREVSSANSLWFDKLSERSLIYTLWKKGDQELILEELLFANEEYWSFKTTLFINSISYQ